MRKPGHDFHEHPDDIPTMMLVREVSKIFHDKLRSANEQAGIPDGYRHILFALAIENGRTQCEISCLTRLKAPTVSVALQKMEADGLVTRVTDAEDQRQSRIFITEKGRECNEICHTNLINAEKLTLLGVTPEEEAFLKKCLTKMKMNLIESTENDK